MFASLSILSVFTPAAFPSRLVRHLRAPDTSSGPGCVPPPPLKLFGVMPTTSAPVHRLPQASMKPSHEKVGIPAVQEFPLLGQLWLNPPCIYFRRFEASPNFNCLLAIHGNGFTEQSPTPLLL